MKNKITSATLSVGNIADFRYRTGFTSRSDVSESVKTDRKQLRHPLAFLPTARRVEIGGLSVRGVRCASIPK